MPKYIAKDHLIQNGAIVQPEQEIELTKEQADRLGDKVEFVGETEVDPYADLTVPELKEIAEGLDIENFKNLKREELILAIEASK